MASSDVLSLVRLPISPLSQFESRRLRFTFAGDDLVSKRAYQIYI